MVSRPGLPSWSIKDDGMKPPTATRPLTPLLGFHHLCWIRLLTRKLLNTGHCPHGLLGRHFSSRLGRHPHRTPGQPHHQETRRQKLPQGS